MTEQEFIKAIADLGLTITLDQQKKLELVYNTLIETNTKMNLTRITAKEDVYLKHFYDSLTIAKIVDLSKVNTICDIGSGAGFPGIILKIFYDNLDITLIDALNKRVVYLNNLIEKLNLKNIRAYHLRAEDLIRKRKTFDLVTARAVASLPKLLPWAMPLVNSNGSFIAMKGNVLDELNEAKKIMIKKNWYLNNQITFSLPNNAGTRTLLELKKK